MKKIVSFILGSLFALSLTITKPDKPIRKVTKKAAKPIWNAENKFKTPAWELYITVIKPNSVPSIVTTAKDKFIFLPATIKSEKSDTYFRVYNPTQPIVIRYIEIFNMSIIFILKYTNKADILY